MRIISKYKDYYDYLQAFDEDRDTLYVRDQHHTHIKEDIIFRDTKFNVSLYPFNRKFIVFCGKIYPFLERDTKKYWSKEEINSIKDKEIIKLEKSIKIFFTSKYGVREQIVFSGNSIVHDDICVVKPPCYLIEDDISPYNKKIEFNPILKDLGFSRVLNSTEAYQELLMYFNRQHRPEKPIPKIDDKIMAEIKGFDKWSFRKEPAKK